MATIGFVSRAGRPVVRERANRQSAPNRYPMGTAITTHSPIDVVGGEMIPVLTQVHIDAISTDVDYFDRELPKGWYLQTILRSGTYTARYMVTLQNDIQKLTVDYWADTLNEALTKAVELAIRYHDR